MWTIWFQSMLAEKPQFGQKILFRPILTETPGFCPKMGVLVNFGRKSGFGPAKVVDFDQFWSILTGKTGV